METQDTGFLYLIPLVPLAVALINGLVGRYLPRIACGTAACVAMAVSFFYAVRAVFGLFYAPREVGTLTQNLWTWMTAGNLRVEFALMVDGLTSALILVVTGVGFLIHLYSIGYMEHEEDWARYFCQLNLFAAFMLVLVMASNLLVMFIGWEGVGACSYLLIGYYFSDDEKASAGKKAFLVNRVGDVFFVLGVLLLLVGLASQPGGTPTLDFRELAAQAHRLERVPVAVALRSGRFHAGGAGAPGAAAAGVVESAAHATAPPDVIDAAAASGPLHGEPAGAGGTGGTGDSGGGVALLTVVALLLFAGATGKSAQIPLYVWLPDAMAGPTPVSALIHAATMVTAGVFMCCRLNFLFARSPAAMAVVAWVGAATALFAALIALAQRDIKKVLAYSTISQLGYMFLAVGVGAWGYAIFHLTTHAFFKALLFLGAGSVIHALHGEQDIFQMGGLHKRLRGTYLTFLVGALALSGIPPFAGFFSKDQILYMAWASPRGGGPALYAIGLLTAVLTSFYMFRLISLVFWGESRVDKKHRKQIHEAPPSMLGPLLVLAVLSFCGGLLNFPHIFWGSEILVEKLGPVFEHAAVHPPQDAGLELGLMMVSVLAAACGIYTAVRLYLSPDRDVTLGPWTASPAHTVVAGKFWVDEIYDALVVRPLLAFARLLQAGFDAVLIDGWMVHGPGRVVGELAALVRDLQSGDVQRYLLLVALGTVSVLVYLIRFHL
jgi:NADH-quinone oxidoreductase subunit L